MQCALLGFETAAISLRMRFFGPLSSDHQKLFLCARKIVENDIYKLWGVFRWEDGVPNKPSLATKCPVSVFFLPWVEIIAISTFIRASN